MTVSQWSISRTCFIYTLGCRGLLEPIPAVEVREAGPITVNEQRLLVWNFGSVFLSPLSTWPRLMPITEVPLSDDHNEPKVKHPKGPWGKHSSGHVYQTQSVWFWVEMDLKKATADIYSYVKAIVVRDAVVGWCRAIMKWPKSEAALLFSLCPFATCCSQNGWAQVGQETPGKITNAPLCLVCGTSSKWSTAPFNWLQSLQSLPLCTPWTCSGAWVQGGRGGRGALGKARGRCYWKMNSFQIGRNILIFIFAPLGICSHVGFLKENVTHSDFWWLWFNLFSLLGPALKKPFHWLTLKLL